MYSFVKVRKYLEYLISVQTLLFFYYTECALKNTGDLFLIKTCSLPKPCLFLKKQKLLGAPIVYRETDDVKDYYFHFLLAVTSDT